MTTFRMLSFAPLARWWPGLALCAALAGLGLALADLPWFAAHSVSALTLALLLGMAFGHTRWHARTGAATGPGVDLARQRLLRLGVVLYGLRLSLHDVGQVGSAGIAIDAAVIASTLLLAWFAGRRWFGLSSDLALLIGAGSAICGAAAVLATEPVLKARAEQVAVAVATVVVFGTLAIFVYPLLAQLDAHWAWIPGGMNGFGIYIGSTVHEVAQVVAAAGAVDPAAVHTAVIAKMLRVMMLAPVLLGLAWWLQRGTGGTRITVPWFAFGFIAVVLLNSTGLLPPAWVAVLQAVDTFVLCAAMAALGVATHVRTVRAAGMRPLALASLLFCWLIVGGALLNHVLQRWLA